MFNLREFVKSTISGMVGREPDYKVREYALGWYNRSELTQDDLAELDTEIVAHNSRPPEPEITEPIEPEVIPPLIEPEIDAGMMVEPDIPTEPPAERLLKEVPPAEEQTEETTEQTEDSTL